MSGWDADLEAAINEPVVSDKPLPGHSDLPSDKIDALRTELFEKGSDFHPTTRSDVVGIDNVLEEIDGIVHWLRNSEAYRRFDARLEPGLIFEGQPGTGKTLVARYMATVSDAHFINVREFPHKNFFTDGDISDLYCRAREFYSETKRPVVLFWDEFEQIGRDRREGGSDSAISAIGQLIAELDGIEGKNTGILLIGCTNYLSSIDSALKRSGRLGIHIEFQAPDREGKKLLLEHYLASQEFDNAIDVDTLSYFFEADDTAADIEEACMEAWRLAVGRSIEGDHDPCISQQDLIKVFIKRLVGSATAFSSLTDAQRMRVAVHETGHALMALVYGIPLRLVTVQPGKKSLGRTMTAKVENELSGSDEVYGQMCVGLGSIVAEEIAGYDASLGATGDYNSTTRLASDLVDDLGCGSRTKSTSVTAIANRRAGYDMAPNISASLVEGADRDIADLLASVEHMVRFSFKQIGADSVMAIASALHRQTTLTGSEFHQIATGILGQDLEKFRTDT